MGGYRTDHVGHRLTPIHLLRKQCLNCFFTCAAASILGFWLIHPDALYWLGEAAFLGEGVEKNGRKAGEYFTLAASEHLCVFDNRLLSALPPATLAGGKS